MNGIQRKVDELGRIVLPIEIRRNLRINSKDDLDLSVEGNKIILKKSLQNCIFCGSEKSLRIFQNKHICEDCLQGIQKSGIDGVVF